MRKSNEERIDELQADTVSNIETLAGRLKKELANARDALALNTQLNADVANLKADLDEARALNRELAKTNDSLEADNIALKAQLSNRTVVQRRQGACLIPILDSMSDDDHPLTLRDVIGSLELTSSDASGLAESLAAGHTIKLVGCIDLDGNQKCLSHVAFVRQPEPIAGVPIELKVTFEKTAEELADIVREELKRLADRAVREGWVRTK